MFCTLSVERGETKIMRKYWNKKYTFLEGSGGLTSNNNSL
jgi:hypothetical protein